MNHGAMLNAYPDSLGGNLSGIVSVLQKPEMKDVFRSFYILPSVFNTDLDRGFSVISYDLNRRLTRAEDLEHLADLGLDLKLDFILNHLSVLSPQFQDILEKGDASEYRDFFIDWNRFWEGRGEMTQAGYIQPEADAMKDMFFRKPGLPILMVRFPDGREVPYWNTFYQEVRYDAPDAQDLMHALGLQYCQAEVLAGRIAAACQAGEKPGNIDTTDILDEEAGRALTAYMESRRKYLGQMDVNINSPKVWEYYDSVLAQLARYGAAIVRLDAFGYASKIPGRRNFMNEPETWDILERVRQMAVRHGLSLLPEIHASYADGSYAVVADKGYVTYDFFLPGLVIDAIENRDAALLAHWAQELRDRKIRTVNMLGCHDGIPLLDLQGLLPEERIQGLIDLIVSRGGMIKNLHGQKNVYYQVNATYYSALGADDRKMLMARALQLFMPGKPQVWYLDLFAGQNDTAAVARSGAGGHKEINRTNLTAEEIEERLTWPVVRAQLDMLRMRNTSPAFGFDADLTVSTPESGRLCLCWQQKGACAMLDADLNACTFTMEADVPDGKFRYVQA